MKIKTLAFFFVTTLLLISCYDQFGSGTATATTVADLLTSGSIAMPASAFYHAQEEGNLCGLACMEMVCNYYQPGLESPANLSNPYWYANYSSAYNYFDADTSVNGAYTANGIYYPNDTTFQGYVQRVVNAANGYELPHCCPVKI